MSDMRVKDLKKILDEITDDALVVMPIIDECNHELINGFRKIQSNEYLIYKENNVKVLCFIPMDDEQDTDEPNYPKHKEPCSAYDPEQERCWGTKEVDPCSCGGNEKDCDFYPEKRR